jgi:hypothetical protein
VIDEKRANDIVSRLVLQLLLLFPLLLTTRLTCQRQRAEERLKTRDTQIDEARTRAALQPPQKW